MGRSASKSADARQRETQLPLPLEPAPEWIRRRLSPLLDERVRLVVNQNRVSLVSFSSREDATVLRVSDRMAGAPEEVIDSIARWVRGGRGSRIAGRRVRAYVTSLPEVEGDRRPQPRLRSVGRWHDLRPLARKVTDQHFPGLRVRAVGWGRPPRKRRRRSSAVRLGSFEESTRIIRIHPALDGPDVPAWVLEFLLFHELLHARLGSTVDGAGRVVFHTPAFRKIERAHPDYERYEAWERGPLTRILARWDRGEEPG